MLYLRRTWLSHTTYLMNRGIVPSLKSNQNGRRNSYHMFSPDTDHVLAIPAARARGAACHPHLLITPPAFVRTATGMVISFYFPGLKTHRLNASVLAVSRIFNPVDLITVTWLTRPVLRSMSSLYRPSPL